jgi:hypothetical protein
MIMDFRDSINDPGEKTEVPDHMYLLSMSLYLVSWFGYWTIKLCTPYTNYLLVFAYLEHHGNGEVLRFNTNRILDKPHNY